jgi:hypothetical protein
MFSLLWVFPEAAAQARFAQLTWSKGLLAEKR